MPRHPFLPGAADDLDRDIDLDREIERAIHLAETLLASARRAETTRGSGFGRGRRERARARRMAAIVGDPAAQAFTMALTDEVARIPDRRRAAARFARLVRAAPRSGLAPVDRILLRVGAIASTVVPTTVMKLVERRLRAESAGVILPAEDRALTDHLANRRAQGIAANVNVLGEAILSEAEAEHRLGLVLEQLARPDVDYVSVKISAVCAHINPVAFASTVHDVSEPIRRLFRAAAGHRPAKFVNLDMEEYRDLELTTVAFRQALDEPEFRRFSAGIVLQAYLPDTHAVAASLGEWARARVAAGGAPIKVRLVKGANLAMELVEAELRGWPAAPFGTKHEVDASYKRLLHDLLSPENDRAVRVGLGSHNLFDIAWGVLARERLLERGAGDRLDFEMLEGMAPAQASAVQDLVGSVLLYSPIVRHEDFPAAIAYLVRRLDENTAPENFLTSLFTIAPGSAEFLAQAERFRRAVRGQAALDLTSRRTQDRRRPIDPDRLHEPFRNEPDTDFTLGVNRAWLADSFAAWRPPDRPPVGDLAAVEHAVATANRAADEWARLSAEHRGELVNRVGDIVAARRGEILVTMAHEAGKTVLEGDPEVSEAIDFARYYARSIAGIERLAADGAPSQPLGVVVVTPPWNFPFAIPMGGVLAALAAGNVVILKPAPETVLSARLAAECCWAAGIPEGVMQMVACPDDEAGTRLVTHPDVAAVILTGAHSTARMFLDWRPALRLHAETSGKNAMVITATADVDAALKDVVRSAFGHAGQKCSAASLAIVEASFYDDPGFRRRLRDATQSLRVSAATDLATDVGPLISPPGDRLRRALTTLDPGETWLVEPRCISDDDRLWTPGIRLGVRPGSWFARTECFGPVLGVMRADDLDHAIDLQNASEYGLTAGLHALDPAEIERWCDRVEAGNLYVNRGMTGAIVQRQPFGGWKQSVVGPTVKAGGPHYVASLRHWPTPADATTPERLLERFTSWTDQEDRRQRDPANLRAEQNRFRLRRLPNGVAVRFGPEAGTTSPMIVGAAAAATGTPTTISSASHESDDEFARRLPALGVDRVRLVGLVGDVVRRAAHTHAIVVDERPPHPHPDVELGRWRQEQVVTRTLHRHGRLTPPVHEETE